MKPYRILIVDDHPMARKAIRKGIGHHPSFDLVGEAENGLQAIALCGELRPDLVLMDIRMPGMSGLEAARIIKNRDPLTKIVMLTVSDDAADLFAALQFGAQGYLLKNMDPDEWISYLLSLADETGAVSRDMADRLFYQFRLPKSPDEPHPDILTAREREIASLVAGGENNRQIGEQLHITENTVKNHIKNILDKLTLDNRVQLTGYAIRHGLLQSQPPEDRSSTDF